MRIDKYLKVSRLIKRRSVAKELCDAGHVKINNRVAKSSSDVLKGDIISIFLKNVTYLYEVVEIREFANEIEASKMYIEKKAQ